jgi:hypothetical protein
MRLCFVIVCLAGIGVGFVHLRKRESVAMHKLLGLETEHVLLRRTAQQQESDLGYLTTPRKIADRATIMGINLARRPVRLVGPAGAGQNRGDVGRIIESVSGVSE